MKPVKNCFIVALLTTLITTMTQAQMTATFNQTVNTQCDGSDCDYSGPSIMINEIMVAPTTNDGSISGDDSGQRGEWIELYNPNLCEPVDISCYFLGSSANQGTFVTTIEGQGIQLPNNTIVPPGGFCVVRGSNAPSVDPNLLVANGGNTVVVTVPPNLTDDGICVNGSSSTRLWFPNAGGWFAFYDANGVAQDAISWGNENGIGTAPCIPDHSTCNTSVTSLDNYNSIPASRKEKIYNNSVPVNGNSIRRMADGGSWQINTGATPTLGDCNSTCATVSTSTCDGTATVNVAGGSGNYTYVWDDSQGQLTQTATGLCEGTYTVKVTDQISGDVETFTVTIEDTTIIVDFDITEELCNYGQTVPMDDISTYSPVPTGGQSGEFFGTGINGSDFNVNTSGVGSFPIKYRYTDENGCSDSVTTNLIVHEIPNAQISNIASEYCLTDSSVELTLSPTGGTLTGSGISNEQFTINDAGTGTHTIQYSVENQYGCKDTTEATVIVHENPTFSLDITNSTCGESDGEIIITPNAGDAPYDYSIDNGINTQTNGTFENLPAGDYEVLVVDDNGCSIALDTSISTTGFEDASFTFEDFCEGAPNGPDNVTSTNGEFSFISSNNDGATIDPITGIISNGVGGTTYTVQHITTGICSDTASIDVTVFNNPIIDFEADTVQGMPPLIVNFTNNSTDADNYTWNFDDGSIQQDDNQYIPHTFHNEGVYTIRLIGETNNGMCADTSTIEIIVMYPEIEYKFPNVFTPNNDGNNDFYKFVNYKNIKSLHIIILNRWGNLIFESNEVNFQWNGRIKNSGGECKDGTYFYKAELENYAGEQIQEHGFIHLNRN